MAKKVTNIFIASFATFCSTKTMPTYKMINTFLTRRLFVVSTLFCGVVSSATYANESQPAITLLLIGDSTVASYPNPPADRPDLTGWGQVLGEFFVEHVTVKNLAISGRSSKSYINEGHWKKALAEQPGYIFIQFGHNDMNGKGDHRATDPAGDYRDYLCTYIREARDIGAKPILVTPMTRRNFLDGKINATLQPYADAMVIVGKAEKTPVVRLHQASVELLNHLGDEGSADFSPSKADRTHFSGKGARAMAQLVVDDLGTLVPELKSYFRNHR